MIKTWRSLYCKIRHSRVPVRKLAPIPPLKPDLVNELPLPLLQSSDLSESPPLSDEDEPAEAPPKALKRKVSFASACEVSPEARQQRREPPLGVIEVRHSEPARRREHGGEALPADASSVGPADLGHLAGKGALVGK